VQRPLCYQRLLLPSQPPLLRVRLLVICSIDAPAPLHRRRRKNPWREWAAKETRVRWGEAVTQQQPKQEQLLQQRRRQQE
jgi:hypothetical protein